MIVTKKHLGRRTVLRGLGTALALPLLDAMVPALTAAAKTAAKPARRLGIVYVPNGVMMDGFTPATEGANFALTPILEPLRPFGDRVLVLTGLAAKEADAKPGEGGGDHARAPAAFLTGAHPRKTEGRDIQAGTSIDQIVARELGRETQLSSLELSLESSEFLGSCDPGYSCAYVSTICWRDPSTPLPMENNPRAVFERLFGGADSTDANARAFQRRRDRSILDSLADSVTRLRRDLGPGDKDKLTQYLEAVRDVERRVQRAEEQSARELPLVEQPAGVPAAFDAYTEVMFDLMVLAYQTDLSRVATLMMGREQSNRAYPQIGVPEPHHSTTHHQGDPEKMRKVAKVNVYHMQLFSSFLEKLRTTPDGDGTLLDHVMVLYGSGISDGDKHDHVNLPILLVGGTGGLKGGRHVRFAGDPPLTNLYLTMLANMGVAIDRFGDSTGSMQELAVG